MYVILSAFLDVCAVMLMPSCHTPPPCFYCFCWYSAAQTPSPPRKTHSHCTAPAINCILFVRLLVVGPRFLPFLVAFWLGGGKTWWSERRGHVLQFGRGLLHTLLSPSSFHPIIRSPSLPSSRTPRFFLCFFNFSKKFFFFVFMFEKKNIIVFNYLQSNATWKCKRSFSGVRRRKYCF